MGDISNEVNYVAADSSIYVGGIFGYNSSLVPISSTYNTGNFRNITTAMNWRISNNLVTAPIYGYVGTTTPQTPNYYLDSINYYSLIQFGSYYSYY